MTLRPPVRISHQRSGNRFPEEDRVKQGPKTGKNALTDLVIIEPVDEFEIGHGRGDLGAGERVQEAFAI